MIENAKQHNLFYCYIFWGGKVHFEGGGGIFKKIKEVRREAQGIAGCFWHFSLLLSLIIELDLTNQSARDMNKIL